MVEDKNKNKGLRFIKNINKTKIFVFFICLLISVALWFFFRINKDTDADIKMQFKIDNAPNSLLLEDNYVLNFYLSGKGIDLIKVLISYPKSQIEADYYKLPIKTMRNKSKTKYILSKDLSQYYIKYFRNEIKIDSISPDTLFFQNINQIKSVKLPIEITAKYRIKDDEMLLNNKINILENRDSVLVDGDTELLKHYKSVKTVSEDLSFVDEKSVYTLKLDKNPELHYSFSHINIKFPVEKYSEMTDTIKIETLNFPKNKKVQIFPTSIIVKYKVPISLYKKINSNNFIATLDYKNKKNSDRIFVNVLSKNKNIVIIDHHPISIKYLLEAE